VIPLRSIPGHEYLGGALGISPHGEWWTRGHLLQRGHLLTEEVQQEQEQEQKQLQEQEQEHPEERETRTISTDWKYEDHEVG